MIGFVRSKTRHVARRTIAVIRDHSQLLLGFEIYLADRRNRLDTLQCRIRLGSVRRPLANPTRNQFPFVRSRRHTLSATVRKNVTRLLQQQTEVRIRRKYTPAAVFVHEIFVIFLRIKPKQRQLKTVLSVRLAMASASVASKLCENRDNFVFKIDWQFFRTTRCADSQRSRLPRRNFRSNRRRPVGRRYDHAFRIDIQHRRNVDGIRHVMRQIMPLSAGIDARHDKLLSRILSDHRR